MNRREKSKDLGFRNISRRDNSNEYHLKFNIQDNNIGREFMNRKDTNKVPRFSNDNTLSSKETMKEGK
jgi:hypothetical protein